MKIKADLKQRILPYKGVLSFILLLLSTHYLWKMCMVENIADDEIAFFSYDLTASFYQLSLLTTRVLQQVYTFLGEVVVVDGTTIEFFSGNKIRIIWGCTGVKQLYMFTAIMFFYPGPRLKKIAFILFGCFVLILFNFIRILVIGHYAGVSNTNFEPLHELFRYLYYGTMFLLWVVWEEKVNLPFQKEKIIV